MNHSQKEITTGTAPNRVCDAPPFFTVVPPRSTESLISAVYKTLADCKRCGIIWRAKPAADISDDMALPGWVWRDYNKVATSVSIAETNFVFVQQHQVTEAFRDSGGEAFWRTPFVFVRTSTGFTRRAIRLSLNAPPPAPRRRCRLHSTVRPARQACAYASAAETSHALC